MFARQGMSQRTRTPTLSQVRAVCTQREPTGRVIIVIVAEREERDDKRGKREERREAKERRTDREKRESKKDREHDRREGFKTLPCVSGKRPHVELWTKQVPLRFVGSKLSLIREFTLHREFTLDRYLGRVAKVEMIFRCGSVGLCGLFFQDGACLAYFVDRFTRDDATSLSVGHDNAR